MNATVGESFTITCTYQGFGLLLSTIHWSRGQDPGSQDCTNTLLRSSGFWVTYQKESRYQLNGKISEGDVSLTIKNVTMGDSGHYCCSIEGLWLYGLTQTSTYLNVLPGKLVLFPLILSLSLTDM